MNEITTVEELDALLGQAGQDAEPLVVREGFRIWILTEDERGQWWAWSWREEGESANPVHAEALTLPLTLLHPLPDTPAPSAEVGEASPIESRRTNSDGEVLTLSDLHALTVLAPRQAAPTVSAEALARAWDEGRAAVREGDICGNSTCCPPATVNPYRQEARRG